MKNTENMFQIFSLQAADVCEALALSQEEAEQSGCVPSALSEPRGPIYWCDNRCSEKAVRYWQIASYEQKVQQGKPRLKLW